MTDETTTDAGLDAPADEPAADGEPGAAPEAAADDAATEEAASADDLRTDGPTEGETAPPRRRGSLAIYGIAFGLMLLAAVCLVVGALGILSIVNVAETSILGTQRILRVSAVLSGLAIVAAIVAVLVPRRSS